MPEGTNDMDITVEINGRLRSASVPIRMNAADFLRHRLGLTGTHVGCEQGVCGMCTISVDGEPVKACIMLAVQLEGAEVRTVESLAQDGKLSRLQEAFKRHHALQCGFCTPAFLMLAKSMETRPTMPSRDEIREEISGTLCRCTGYEGIVRAIEDHLRTCIEKEATSDDSR
ncbi:(2Fe-2S)-binding protein [Oceaniradius stylonematis]|uniref:(2Fe-2S)-binding protein n=1 Tax=Oceaniradius stylonematis TaxID=2184161 RepID=UPI00273DD1B4|nr:(2Fe-2S)-binding protein [Oceaniradius stylonematis]